MKIKGYLFTLLLTTVWLVSGNSIAQAAEESALPEGVCDGAYVLCTSAPCIPNPSNYDSENPTNNAICNCVTMLNGLNYGLSSCAERKPVTDKYGVTTVLSEYSFAQVPAREVITCPSGNAWTDCLDKQCVIDPADPAKAICTCDLVRDGEFVSYGGSCNQGTCATAYWSAATQDDFDAGSQALATAMGLEDVPAIYCDAASQD